MRLDESFLNDLARDNLTDQATQMAAGTEPPGATPMTMGEFATSVADVPAGLLKGAVQGTVGLPGDIESLTYGVRELFNRRADEGALDAFLRGLEQKTILPTTENVKKWLDENVGTLVPAGASERRTEAAKIPEFVGELGGAGKTVIEASKAAGRGLGQVTGASADMAARTPAMQAGSVKPSAFMPNQAAPAAEPQRSGIGFYSAVEKAVLDSKQDKGTGAQFLAQITKTQGVKPEELKWTGLDEFLKGKKSVTKQEIQDYLNANRVDVREVRLGGFSGRGIQDLEIADDVALVRSAGFEPSNLEDPNMFGFLGKNGDILGSDDLSLLAQDKLLDSKVAQAADRVERYLLDQARQTQFSSYTLPGGENYREILLTLPQKVEKGFMTPNGAFFSEADLADPIVRSTAEKIGLSPAFRNVGDAYRSTHFDQPNILAHMRVNDRVVDGKKTLFIEEIQSDWHQAGRKKGYAGADTKNAEAAFKQYSQELADKYNLNPEQNLSMYATMKGMQPEEVAKYDELQSAWVSSKGGVPDAPFKTSWHELTLKRAIQEASEKGYDQIAFTTGKTQAERYDLSKQVDELLYKKNPDGTYRLSAQVRGRGQSFGDSIPESKLEEYVGKEVAKSITQGSGKDVNLGGPSSFTQPRDDWKSMSGLDLKVGGEGMKGFYDNILPKSLEKLGKKFDAKVTKTKMKAGQDAVEPGMVAPGIGMEFPGKTVPAPEVEVWTMDITPKMRETVTKQGQPLFQIGVGGGAAAGAATMQQPGEQM